MITTPAAPPSRLEKGKALIDVSVSESGAVISTKVVHSSGDVGFDRAATKVAKESSYARDAKLQARRRYLSFHVEQCGSLIVEDYKPVVDVALARC